MGKKWIVGLMILAALWAMTGCGKQEMIRCEYTNEAAGFTLSIDRPVEWTAKLQEGWPATETEEASPDEGIRLFPDDSQESSIYFCNSFSPYYAGDENDLETVEVNEELTALHGIETSGEGVSESYVLKGISPVRDSITLPSLCHKRIIKNTKRLSHRWLQAARSVNGSRRMQRYRKALKM